MPFAPAFWSGIEPAVRASATFRQLFDGKAPCLVPQQSLSAAQPSCRKALSLLPEEARLGVLGNLGALLMSAGRLSDSLEVIEDSILVAEKYGHEDTDQVGPASMLPPVTRCTSQNNMSRKETQAGHQVALPVPWPSTCRTWQRHCTVLPAAAGVQLPQQTDGLHFGLGTGSPGHSCDDGRLGFEAQLQPANV